MATLINKIQTSNNILSGSQVQLVVTRDMIRNYGSPEDFVEMHITDPADKNIFSVSPFNGFTIPGTFQVSTAYTIQELVFDPSTDLKNIGISFGDYKVTYNVLRPKIVKDYNPSLFIKEISGDRTEIRLSTNNIDNSTLITNTIEFIDEFQSLPYFKEFYLNFGKNQLLPAINVALDTGGSALTTNNTSVVANPSQTSTVLIKLLNPLPLKYKVNDLLSVVDEIANPQVFSANITLDPVPVTFPTLRGPNFDLDLDNLRVGPTPYYNFNQVTHFNGQFAPQLQQLLGQLSASNFAINIDYTDYENFVHYSSAARRLEGFHYKLSNIEFYTSASASAAQSINVNSLTDAVSYQNKINGVIQSFDGYENYLYFESSSYTWPKTNPNKPYINALTSSAAGTIWYNENYESALLYDDNNQNYLLYALPGYVAENDSNELAFQFVASIGQMFDDIWIHIKAISDLYQAKNSLTEGISKDLVYFALQSMGINVYNDQDGNNVFKYLYGVDSDGNYLPQTSSYETLVSASNYQLSGQDLQKGIYKRLYHNLPLLLKSKGTNRFIQYLNTIFGIPDTIMSYTEYGGVDKVTSSFEYEYDRFTYALDINGNIFNQILVPWPFLSQSLNRTGNSDITPDAIELRIKQYVTESSYMVASLPTQSILRLVNNSTNDEFNLKLIYAQTGSSNSIYSGSVGEFGYFQLCGRTTCVTSSTIPIFTTGSYGQTSWYNVLLQRRIPNRQSTQTSDNQYYDLYVKNNIWGEIGHIATASLYVPGTTNINNIWYNEGILSIADPGTPFSGSIQELRLWSNHISESTFDSHVLNPESIEGNYTSSAYDDLAARFALGNDLYTYDHSTVSTVSSVAPDQKIQAFSASFNNFEQNTYTSFTEWYYADVANSGLSNPVVDKIRIYSGSEYGTQLLPNKSIEVSPIIPITKDIHLLDAGLSPQDEINRDIIAHFGSTYDLDSIIGNPSTGSYQQFPVLQQEYFKKYVRKYNYKDYIRLIEFFHNSLFRTLKDFTPARTNLTTGIIIKPHLLERPRVLRPEPFVTDNNNILSTIDTAFLTASNGGGYIQSPYNITYQSANGPISLPSDGRDFFVGVLPSSSINYHSLFNKLNVNPYRFFNPIFYYNPLIYISSYYSASVWNYSYNALQNNVSGSRISNQFQKVTYINSGSKVIPVFEPLQFQDFTMRYARHILPRYNGSKTTSTNYNFYDSVNDPSFGTRHEGGYDKSPTIDKNTIQFSYFNQAVATGSQLLAAQERTNLYLKYLISEDSSLTELTSRKYFEDDNVTPIIKNNEFWNLYRVQNIYKQGETLNISLFDNQVPTKQKSLEGNKLIFNSGYKYYPYLWKQQQQQTLQYFLPQGQSNNPFLNPNNYSGYQLNRSSGQINQSNVTWGGINYYYDLDVAAVCLLSPNLIPFDIKITLRVDYIVYTPPFAIWENIPRTRYVDLFIYRTNTGTPNYTTAPVRISENGRYFKSLRSITAVSCTPANGLDPGAIFEIVDQAAYFEVDQLDKMWISASAAVYSNSGGPNQVFFSSSNAIDNGGPIDSIINVYTGELPPEYPINFNVMDLVRFDSQSSATPTRFFKEENEYFITAVNRTGPALTFKLNKPVEDFLTSTTIINGRTAKTLDRYIFSKRVADETNIVIRFQKNPGVTSGGIIKNSNLLLSIDNKVADIVSGLKSKIFSTVLVS
jgi:hypothetical protein